MNDPAPAGILDTWIEEDGTEVWLIEPDLGDVDALAGYARAHAVGIGPLVLGANADGADPERCARLESLGFTRVFSMVELRRDLTPIAAVTDPAIRIRTARVDDAIAMHASAVRTWAGRAWHLTPIEERFIAWVEGSDLSWFFVAESGSELAGYIAGEVDGDIVTADDVLVDSAFQRRGIGTLLMAELVAKAAAEGKTTLRLETEGDDPVGARAFYHRVGFVTHRVDERFRIRLR